VVSTVFLAQVSVPRLGETNRGSPKLFCTNSRFERGVISLRREEVRLSENPQELLFYCSSSRLGEKELA